jgi:hypothetical protein
MNRKAFHNRKSRFDNPNKRTSGQEKREHPKQNGKMAEEFNEVHGKPSQTVAGHLPCRAECMLAVATFYGRSAVRDARLLTQSGVPLLITYAQVAGKVNGAIRGRKTVKLTVTFEVSIVEATAFLNRMVQDGGNAHHLKTASIGEPLADIKAKQKHSATFVLSPNERKQDFESWVRLKAEGIEFKTREEA